MKSDQQEIYPMFDASDLTPDEAKSLETINTVNQSLARIEELFKQLKKGKE